MTGQQNNQYSGIPPMPEFNLTMEQQFKLRRLEDLLPEADKKDIITLFMALQKQCFVLGNNMTNLLKKWPNHPNTTEAIGKSETSSENKS